MTPTSYEHNHIVHRNKHHVPFVFLVLYGAWTLRMTRFLQNLSLDDLNMATNGMLDAATSVESFTSLISGLNSFTVFTGCVAVYLLGLSIYRLYLTPSAKFPGPRLAALCYWYEFYYDVWPHEGQYTWKIRQLHEKYGT